MLTVRPGHAERAGVDANPHDLRHTCATRLFTVDRWNPAEVQRFLGHSDPRITLAIYTHLSSDDLPAPSPS
jgi:integrase